jgi:hypothetical protein
MPDYECLFAYAAFLTFLFWNLSLQKKLRELSDFHEEMARETVLYKEKIANQLCANRDRIGLAFCRIQLMLMESIREKKSECNKNKKRQA